MLPRVSAALAQFIAPIATSGNQNLPTQQGFERFTPGGKKKSNQNGEPGGDAQKQSQQQPQQSNSLQPGPSNAQIIPFPGKTADSTKPPLIPNGISQALLQLMNLLHDQRTNLIRWLGPAAYQLAVRQQKKNGRIRKGTVLDEKAE